MSQPLFPPVLVISGTGTDVGKTVVSAALAALGADHGLRVAVVKARPDRRTAGRPPLNLAAAAVFIKGVDADMMLVGRHDPLARHPEPHRAHPGSAGPPPADLCRGGDRRLARGPGPG